MANNQIYYANGGGDEQYTPIKTVEILLPYIQHLKDKIIWCPFDREDSQFVKILTNNGFDVVYSHIDYGQDFFKYEPKQWDVIISNPPYHNKRAFWERCLDLKKPFTLLLPVNILSDSIINATMRERERENCACSSQVAVQGFTTQRPAKLVANQHSKRPILVSVFSNSNLYWPIYLWKTKRIITY